MTNLPATTPIADLVRWAKMRWRIEPDYHELKHGLGLDEVILTPRPRPTHQVVTDAAKQVQAKQIVPRIGLPAETEGTRGKQKAAPPLADRQGVVRRAVAARGRWRPRAWVTCRVR